MFYLLRYAFFFLDILVVIKYLIQIIALILDNFSYFLMELTWHSGLSLLYLFLFEFFILLIEYFHAIFSAMVLNYFIKYFIECLFTYKPNFINLWKSQGYFIADILKHRILIIPLFISLNFGIYTVFVARII